MCSSQATRSRSASRSRNWLAAWAGYLAAVLVADGTDIACTGTFSALWSGGPHRVLTSCITAAQQCTDDIDATVTIGNTVLGLPLLGFQAPFAPPADTLARCRSTLARERDPCTTLSRLGDIVQELADSAAADSGYPG